MTDTELFENLVNGTLSHRAGVDKLLEWLKASDFYVAPCSTKYHLASPGGLAKHSLNVYFNLLAYCKAFNLEFSAESLAIVGLFHDLCKVNYYERQLDGTYKVKDSFPVGHGEKSVIILQNFIKLTTEELLAIRWHMGGFDSAVKGNDYSYSSAQTVTKLITALQCADLTATFITEK